MKNFVFASFVLVIVLTLSSCTLIGGTLTEKEVSQIEERLAKLEADVLSMKFELGLVNVDVAKNVEEEVIVMEDDDAVKDEKEEEIVKEEKEEPKVTHSIEIDSPEDETLVHTAPVEFKGTVSKGATKIVVTASSIDSKDVYILQNFKLGDESFWYKADSSFGNLVPGSNEFTFEAYFENEEVVSEKLTVYYLHN